MPDCAYKVGRMLKSRGLENRQVEIENGHDNSL